MDIFLEKYDSYTSEDSCCQRIDLARNFRSRREVVDTVNGIFAGIMSRHHSTHTGKNDGMLAVRVDA